MCCGTAAAVYTKEVNPTTPGASPRKCSLHGVCATKKPLAQEPFPSVYTKRLASLQRVRVHGHSYWRIVQSRRVNGKPRPVLIAHLGKADQLLARLQASEALKLRSRSHGAVAALYALAKELDVVGTIDRHLAASGRRGGKLKPGRSQVAPRRHDGLSVGQSLLLAAIGRACHATSKRAFAAWARTTTLGELASVDVERLTSQHFWDQMDQLPIDTIEAVEGELIGRVVERFALSLETLLYDATNFFTFIASTNKRPELPARGHNKQKRHDLRQVGLALLCTGQEAIPLWHKVYGGHVPDAKSFPQAVTALRRRLVELDRQLAQLTVVYDKGNVSRANQRLVDDSGLHYVASLTVSTQRALIGEANLHLELVVLREEEVKDAENDQTVMAYRTRRSIFGAERTVVVVLSQRLREGQQRGILQHVASARRWLDRLAATLQRGRQKRDRARIQRDIETRLMGRQNLRKVLRVNLGEENGKLHLQYDFDQDAFDILSRDWLGRIVLVTDRDEWSTAEIIRAYRGQSEVEAVFAHLKDPVHVALRPQYHWTDQKLHVHVFICLLGYLLARLLHFRVREATGYPHSMERLLEDLEQVRKVTVVRHTGAGRGRLRVTAQLEDCPAELEPLIALLGVDR